MQTLTSDIVVVGSGAGGGTIAGKLWRAGRRVLVLEAGGDRFPEGLVHSRNMHPRVADDPKAGAIIDKEWVFPCGSAEPIAGLPGYRVSHGLGGMTSLWTANCPTPLQAEVWGSWTARGLSFYLERARECLSVSTQVNGSSRRGKCILDRLAGRLRTGPGERPVQHMPVAIRWQDGKPYYVSSGDLLSGRTGDKPPVRLNSVCHRLNERAGRIESVDCVTDGNEAVRVSGSVFILATGGISIPQIIQNSGLDVGPAIGRHVTDHCIVTSQLRLSTSMMAEASAEDPLFSVWMPASEERPWQSEVFRHPQDPFPGCDPSMMADVCSFSRVEALPENRVIFADGGRDRYGLPSASVHIRLSERDLIECRQMQEENLDIARTLCVPEYGICSVLGALGSAGHLMGTCRSGESDDGTNVTDLDCKFWRLDNLYAAGLPVLGAASACNPTLTCVAYGLRTADAVLKRA